MKFEEASIGLWKREFLTREKWSGEFIKFSGNELIQISIVDRSFEKMNLNNEDKMADDWIIVRPSDEKQFYLSEVDLMNLGVGQLDINEMKKDYSLIIRE